MCQHNPIQCIIPPYITDELMKSTDPVVRSREVAQAMPTLMAVLSPDKKKSRQVFDAKQSDQLPGQIVRSEGDPKSNDGTVNEAFDGAGDTYDFYDKIFQRNSLDDNGMTLISSVHVGEVDDNGNLGPMNNAFWNGEQMAYGD